MNYNVDTIADYMNALPADRKDVINQLRTLAKENLPEGFEEQLTYGMIGYVVPHSIYPDGYHVNPEQALPFLSFASQKNHVAVYHSGVYADEELLNWFKEEYAKQKNVNKLNMGKSCIRFTNVKKIPYELLGELFTKMTVKEWIGIYERIINN